jgi:perosamine synthetase
MELTDIEAHVKDWRLAAEGGPKLRSNPMPRRMAMGAAEIAMVNEAMAAYQAEGVDPGYQGLYEKRYTDNFVDFMGGGFADAVATGSASVFIALAALDLPKGSEVIVSPITDPGTLSAIIMNGLRPRLADSKPMDYNMGAQQVRARLSKNVSAVCVVHSAGQATEIDSIVAVAREAGIKVIEDCSQSHGATWKGRQVGTFGDIAAFSTMYRKNHMTGGSGGVVFTRDLNLYRMALAHADRGKPRWLADFDDRNPSGYLFPAMNWNTDELSCAIGIASLKRLPDTIVSRLAFVSELASLLAEMDTMFRLYPWTPCDSPFIATVYVDLTATHRSKRDIAEALRAEGIDLNPHYAYVASEWKWLLPYAADDFDTPNARQARDESFCLYLNEKYGEAEALDVAAAMLKVHRAWGISKPKQTRKVIPVVSG